MRQDVGDVVGGDLAHGVGVEEELVGAAGGAAVAAAAAHAGCRLRHGGLFPRVFKPADSLSVAVLSVLSCPVAPTSLCHSHNKV